MALTCAVFVAAFPEFQDSNVAQVEFWLEQAANLSPRAFGKNYTLAQMLFVAHNLTLAKRDAVAAGKGDAGQVSGPVTSKSVGPVSVSRDTGAITYDGAGAYNSTAYGIRYWGLLRGAATGHYMPSARNAGRFTL